MRGSKVEMEENFLENLFFCKFVGSLIVVQKKFQKFFDNLASQIP